MVTKLEYYGNMSLESSFNPVISMCTEDWRSPLDYTDVPFSICHVCNHNGGECHNKHALSSSIRLSAFECRTIFNDEYLNDINNDDCFCPRPLKQRYVCHEY